MEMSPSVENVLKREYKSLSINYCEKSSKYADVSLFIQPLSNTHGAKVASPDLFCAV